MTTKIALTASILLFAAISGAVAQEGSNVHSRRWSSAFAFSRTESRVNAFDWAAPMSAAEPDARRYHGGPKSND